VGGDPVHVLFCSAARWLNCGVEDVLVCPGALLVRWMRRNAKFPVPSRTERGRDEGSDCTDLIRGCTVSRASPATSLLSLVHSRHNDLFFLSTEGHLSWVLC
jgi:hypothetical protein